jgi:phosphotransferase system HPr (HPr) family protein
LKKVTLPDALHARPASMLVRVASALSATVTIKKGEKRANAKSILEVLGLGAAKGDAVEIETHGDCADDAMQTVLTLIERNFSADLVPETGAAAVPGIAIGRAHVLVFAEIDDTTDLSHVRDAASTKKRFDDAKKKLESDLVRMPPHERELFEPELAILDELAVRVASKVTAGASFRDAVVEETSRQMTDLFADARARLLDHIVRVDFGDASETVILVSESLPPSLVAALPPHVEGIVSAIAETEEKHGTGNTSHAAILAKSRGIPLAYVGEDVTSAIEHGDVLVLDTTEAVARVFIGPSDELLEQTRARRTALENERTETSLRAEALARALAEKGGTKIRVNVSRNDESLPKGAHGVGLVRTELVFAAKKSEPTREEQAAAYRDIASAAAGAPVSIRLFDAGGDKPLAWLPSSDPNMRGAALLLAHPKVLETQLRAIADARSAGDAGALIPLAESADDVRRVRALAPAGLRIGAMIETANAAAHADEIAAEADYVSIGTNDLTASVLGTPRNDAVRGLEPPVFSAIERVVASAHARGREVTVCGELAAHHEGAKRLVAAGVDALSVAVVAFSRVVEIISKGPTS